LRRINRVSVMNSGLRVGAVLATVFALVVVAACTGDGERYGELPTPEPSASKKSSLSPSPSPSLSDEQQIIAQYKRFWTEVLPKAYAARRSERQAILQPVVVDPALTKLLRNMAAQDADGKRAYGADIPLRQNVEVVKELSLVRGCLDSSKSGLMEAQSGKKLNRGPAQNPVLVNLMHSLDGSWRVSFVKFPGGSKC
jgi:hypothetical protein